MCPAGQYALVSRPKACKDEQFLPQLTVYVRLFPDVEKAVEVPLPEALYDDAEGAAEYSLSFGKQWVKANQRSLEALMMEAAGGRYRKG